MPSGLAPAPPDGQDGRRVRPRAPWSRSGRRVPRLVVRPLQEFLHWEAAGGLVLVVATACALVWGNLDQSAYAAFWETELRLEVGGWELTEDLRHLVNDGLMALFFLVIGLEVKRELVVGELSAPGAARLPVFAALGGMVVPAALFLAITGGGEDGRGWGMPIATDTAFALGVLALLGRRAPVALTAFLLALVVVDDVAALTLVAVFYSGGIALPWLGAAVLGLAAIVALNRLHVRHLGVYLVLGTAVWLATFESGVHATIAGVALGLLTPVRPFQPTAAVRAEADRVASAPAGRSPKPDVNVESWRRLAALSREAISPLARVEHALHPWTSYVVLPVFALANAGVLLDAASLRGAAESPVTAGVIAGLVVGKPLGIVAGALLATRLGLARLPRGITTLRLAGVGCIAGIGFTVSVFISALAYTDEARVSAAKIGILIGSVLAAVMGTALLLLAARRERRTARVSAPVPDPA